MYVTNIDPTAEIHSSVRIPATTRVWGHTQVRENAVIGENCSIGRNVYIGPGVIIGNNCKIQNNALIYEPAVIEDGVFVGPGVTLTNDRLPRAINLDGSLKTPADWESVGVILKKGSSIGANSVCLAPLEVGEWAAVGAGSVVTRDVPARTLVVGNPAKPIGEPGF